MYMKLIHCGNVTILAWHKRIRCIRRKIKVQAGLQIKQFFSFKWKGDSQTLYDNKA